MKRIFLLSLVLIGIVLPNQLKAQTEIQNDASKIACNCIDSLTSNSISERDSIVNCFYKAASQAINKKYYKNGKLRLSGKRFIIISGDILYYLQENLYKECPSYKYQIDSTNMDKIKFR